MVSLLSGDDGGIGDQREVDPGVGHQVGLELSQVHVEGSIKSQGGGDGGHDLANKSVEVGVGRSVNIQVTPADVVDCLIVNHEGTVRMLQGCMSSQDSIVGLNHSSGYLRSWVDGKLQLRLLSIVNRKTLHEKRRKSRSSSSTKGMEEKKSLKTSTLISKLP